MSLQPAYAPPVQTFSTAAFDTGRKWHDGKTIWRKILLASGNQGTGVKSYAHGITSVDRFIQVTGFLTRDDATKQQIPINYGQTGAALWGQADNTNVVIVIDAIYTGAGNQLGDLEVILEYTLT